ncbi:Gfo/Idh/MocA family protein [Botrimarina mediterranea]|uniref:Glucose--fructose oxidoreductase n=1 Tax=Botrimarina mediterranea TaxID=2528022 RepID=A0A518K5W1_9BACT|nr:Gfo/Idh/MocA family oxidoreductase [Botrimarina mediterranea]QDV73181.1 Glucose--fructose oxidoreductase precursor [Botrimarina mediterranea]QDV77754.1 Glucose--fructose oxidoreductase precursor [Planctomycetes bacterium K2D]
MRRLLVLFLLLQAIAAIAADPVRVAIVGVSHDHVFGLLGRPRDIGDIEIVAVVDADRELAMGRMSNAGLDKKLYYQDLEQALAAAKPQAAVLFGSIRAHHEQAIACAGAGVHVMVEKPLATNLADARAMVDAAERAGVQLLTNYETTWYRNLHEIKRRVDAHEQGNTRRMVFRMGHAGPIEIGCREPFLEWLLDPAENGGGAVTDFGCYGANLATWLMNGERPIAVSCVTKRIKPRRYPNVDDDATITIEYADAVAVVQASWNWPFNVKDAVVYGATGELSSKGDREVSGWRHGEDRPTTSRAPELPEWEGDPFAHLAAVVRGEAKPNALSSVENNLLVVEVLDAARQSAKTGQRVVLSR